MGISAITGAVNSMSNTPGVTVTPDIPTAPAPAPVTPGNWTTVPTAADAPGFVDQTQQFYDPTKIPGSGAYVNPAASAPLARQQTYTRPGDLTPNRPVVKPLAPYTSTSTTPSARTLGQVSRLANDVNRMLLPQPGSSLYKAFNKVVKK